MVRALMQSASRRDASRQPQTLGKALFRNFWAGDGVLILMKAGAFGGQPNNKNKMKKIITYLAAGLLFVGAQSLMAQSTTNSTPPAKHQALTPEQKEQRAALMKALDLTPADLKGLTGQERAAKMKEAATKVVADLKAKQASGALSAEDQTKLETVQKFLAHGHKKAPAAPSNN
jgi:hypothetical protein